VGRRGRAREREGACTWARRRVRMCAGARAWVESSHPNIYQPPTTRVPGGASHPRACLDHVCARARMCARVCACVCACMYVCVSVYVYTRQNSFNKALTLAVSFSPYVYSS